jgi:gliding motility-associated-like protein
MKFATKQLGMCNLKFIYALFFIFCHVIYSHSQSIEQDCSNAIPICFDTYTQTKSYSGEGFKENEIGPSSCLTTGEVNNVWYTFTVESPGNLGFLITPNNVGVDDYDWAVYNLTNNTCDDVFRGIGIEASCNYAQTAGPTGATVAGTSKRQGALGTLTNAQIPVKAGEIYVIIVSNFSSSQSGYTLDFVNHSDASIFDTTPPDLREELVREPVCGDDTLFFRFSENIICSTFEIEDIKLESTSGLYNVQDIYSEVCSLPGRYEKDFAVILNQSLVAGEELTIELTGEVLDACSNTGFGGIIDISISDAHNAIVVIDEACPNKDLSLTVNAVGGSTPYRYSYFSDGLFDEMKLKEKTLTFSGDSAGIYPYRVIITDRNGEGCGVLKEGEFEITPSPDAGFSVVKVGETSFFFNRNTELGTSKWDFGDGATDINDNPTYDYGVSDVFTVAHFFTSFDGCIDTFYLEVDIENIPEDESPNLVLIPTGFSPNGDGINDEFFPRNFGLKSIILQVYNRWGELIYEISDFEQKWDGTIGSNIANDGIYSYKAVGTSFAGKEFFFTGTLTVVR